MKKHFELLKNYKNFDVDKLQKLMNENVYSFEYNEIACVNSNLDCEKDRFQKNVKIVMKFTIHSIDLTKFKKFDYFFRMQSLYLIDDNIVNVIKTF